MSDDYIHMLGMNVIMRWFDWIKMWFDWIKMWMVRCVFNPATCIQNDEALMKLRFPPLSSQWRYLTWYWRVEQHPLSARMNNVDQRDRQPISKTEIQCLNKLITSSQLNSIIIIFLKSSQQFGKGLPILDQVITPPNTLHQFSN